MSLMPCLRPEEPPLNPDGFKTTTEALEFIVKQYCSGADPDRPFLIVTNTIAYQMGEWPALQTRAWLGIFGESAPLIMAVGDRLIISARWCIEAVPDAPIIEKFQVISYRNFEHTPLKEPFAPPFGSYADPCKRFRPFTLAVGKSAIERLVLDTRAHFPYILPWYMKATYCLATRAPRFFMAYCLQDMCEAREHLVVEMIERLLDEHERMRTSPDSALGTRIRDRLASLRSWGLHTERNWMSVRGIDYQPARLIYNLEELYAAP